jgi:prepilin-type N-terminal cleavage/methylation domain-containing protein
LNVAPATAGLNRQHAGGQRAARAGNRAFTLVEIVVVVMILGLMITVVVTGTYLVFRDRETLKGEARKLAGFLQNVRAQAAIKGKTYHVEYNLKDKVYFAWFPKPAQEGEVVSGSDEDEQRTAGAYFELPSRTGADGRRVYTCWIDRIVFADGSVAREESVRLPFAPKGGGHWHYVYLTNADGEFYTVEINPFTGSADTFPGEIKPEPPERLK